MGATKELAIVPLYCVFALSLNAGFLNGNKIQFFIPIRLIWLSHEVNFNLTVFTLSVRVSSGHFNKHDSTIRSTVLNDENMLLSLKHRR